MGFEAERLWGPYNDWEPAIAIDRVHRLRVPTEPPVNDGPEPCKRCAGPYIIFRPFLRRRGNLGSDQFLAPFRKSHNDPQIEVAVQGRSMPRG